jgi:hypothetical protein
MQSINISTRIIESFSKGAIKNTSVCTIDSPGGKYLPYLPTECRFIGHFRAVNKGFLGGRTVRIEKRDHP